MANTAARGIRSFGRAAIACILLAAGLALAAPLTASAGPRPSGSAYSFTPYVDLAAWPPPSLRAMRRASHASGVVLGFVTASGGERCAPTWGGYAAYPASGAHAYQLAQVRALRRSGGTVVASFGGATGVELAVVCPSARALERVYGRVVATYGLARLDVDIEGYGAGDPAVAARRAKALAELQRAAARRGHPLSISLTLPVLPSGLTPEARQILRITVRGGVRISLVNGMAMDYGDSNAPDPAHRMGTYAIDAAENMRDELSKVFRIRRDAAARRVGITPMIGLNDVAGEVFTVADARQLARYARRNGLGQLSMWVATRDRECPGDYAEVSENCSGVTQAPWAFSHILSR